jgi:hypothetical protein
MRIPLGILFIENIDTRIWILSPNMQEAIQMQQTLLDHISVYLTCTIIQWYVYLSSMDFVCHKT